MGSKFIGKHTNLIIIAIAMAFAVVSCKTTKVGSGIVNLTPMSANEILDNFEENAFEYDYLSVKKISCSYEDNKKSLSFRASIKAIKDQQILISATKLGFPIARLLLSPDSVIFINYFEQTYLHDDYIAFSKKFKLDLDFEAIQAVLSNDILSKNNKKFVVSEDDKMYVLKTRKRVEPAEIAYFNPVNFMISRYLVADEDEKQYLKVSFDDFISLEDKNYPSAIEVHYQSDTKMVNIKANMSKFSTDKIENLSLSIPDSYEELRIK